MLINILFFLSYQLRGPIGTTSLCGFAEKSLIFTLCFFIPDCYDWMLKFDVSFLECKYFAFLSSFDLISLATVMTGHSGHYVSVLRGPSYSVGVLYTRV